MKKSNIVLLIWILLFIIMIISAYKFNWVNIICIGFNSTCTSFKIPNLWIVSISLFSAIVPIIMLFWRSFTITEIQDEKNNHLSYLRTIKEKEGIIDILYFEDFNEAKNKFKSYKKWYILPIWYLYDIWELDRVWKDIIIERLENTEINNLTISLLDWLENGDDYKLEYAKKFIDLEEYIEKMNNKWKKIFSLNDKGIQDIFSEEYFIELDNKEKIVKKEKIIEVLKKNISSFTLIKGYYILYYKN